MSFRLILDRQVSSVFILGTAQSGVKGHLISSLPLDWALMQELAPASSAAGANFDSLMVPFRCVGSDVLAKTDTVFSHGYLPEKIRASISFPFLHASCLDGGEAHL